MAPSFEFWICFDPFGGSCGDDTASNGEFGQIPPGLEALVTRIAIQLVHLQGIVAQIGLRLSFPFPRMDLVYGDGTWYAKSCEAV